MFTYSAHACTLSAIMVTSSKHAQKLPYILCYPTAPSTVPSTAPSSNPLLPAVAFLTVVVLLLITCVALLVVALAVTASKLNKLRAEKAHTDPPHYYEQTGGKEGKAKEGVYDEVGEGMSPIGGQSGHYQELEVGTMEGRQYESLDKKNTSAKI